MLLPSFPVIDTHMHQWDPCNNPRLVSEAAQAIAVSPEQEENILAQMPAPLVDFVGDPRWMVHPYLPADYAADARAAGSGPAFAAGGLDVTAVVHVQAGWMGPAHDETRWVVDLPWGQAGAPKLAGCIVHYDPLENEAGVLDSARGELADSVLGVRAVGATHPDPGVADWIPTPDLLTQKEFITAFADFADQGLIFELWGYSHQLPDMENLARLYPQTQFVLEHYATPAGVFGPVGERTGHTAPQRANIFAEWKENLARLADCPNVVAKHSGLGIAALGLRPHKSARYLPYTQLRDAVAPLVQHQQEVFGWERTMWGSDYPIDKAQVALPTSASILLEVLGIAADSSAAHALFADNAARVYGVK